VFELGLDGARIVLAKSKARAQELFVRALIIDWGVVAVVRLGVGREQSLRVGLNRAPAAGDGAPNPYRRSQRCRRHAS